MTSVFTENIPTNSFKDYKGLLANGKRIGRIRIYIVGSPISTSHALDLADYIPNLSDIEGQVYATALDVVSSTAVTWSTTVLTLQGNTEVCVVGIIT